MVLFRAGVHQDVENPATEVSVPGGRFCHPLLSAACPHSRLDYRAAAIEVLESPRRQYGNRGLGVVASTMTHR